MWSLYSAAFPPPLVPPKTCTCSFGRYFQTLLDICSLCQSKYQVTHDYHEVNILSIWHYLIKTTSQVYIWSSNNLNNIHVCPEVSRIKHFPMQIQFPFSSKCCSPPVTLAFFPNFSDGLKFVTSYISTSWLLLCQNIRVQLQTAHSNLEPADRATAFFSVTYMLLIYVKFTSDMVSLFRLS